MCLRSVLPRGWLVMLSLTAALTCSASLASAQAGTQGGLTAAWTQQKLTFVVLGFQSRYTCYGLRSYIKNILVELGARQEDINVHEVVCSLHHPPAVAASFWMLEPVSGDTASAVPVHWESVRVRFGGGAGPDLGGCELAHQAAAQILPYFAARNAGFAPDCTEHVPAGTPYELHAQVLKPDTGVSEAHGRPQ